MTVINGIEIDNINYKVNEIKLAIARQGSMTSPCHLHTHAPVTLNMLLSPSGTAPVPPSSSSS